MKISSSLLNITQLYKMPAVENRLDFYSIRQVSPFVGNIQIVHADYCRALSSDGENWQIQASCETHQQVWKISDDQYLPRRYVLYGSWSKQQGFSSLPLEPMLDVPSLQHIENTLVNALQTIHTKLPLAPLDNYECWLIDQQTSLPLALIATTSHKNLIPHIQLKHWQALPQQEKLLASDTALTREDITLLETQINQQGLSSSWFERHADQSANQLDSASGHFSAEQFPELPFNSTLLPESVQEISTRFIDRLSPRLLTLPLLSSATVQRLQQAAQHYALDTAKRMAIYPQPLDPTIYNKISVELKIRGY